MVNLLKQIAKIPLRGLGFFLKKSPDARYFLVKEVMPNEIQQTVGQAFAHQHIDNVCALGKRFFDPSKNWVIVDVGGGTATTATLFAAEFPNLPIYVFEPLAENFKIIDQSPQKTAFWRTRKAAVGSQVGETTINVAHRVTASSLLELDDKIEGYGDYLKLEKKETIAVTTLDASIKKDEDVLILKLDVQGFELEVLKGGAETLTRTKVIVLEINNHEGYKNAPTYYEIDEFLRNSGFRLFDLLPAARVNGKLQDWDAIYVQENK